MALLVNVAPRKVGSLERWMLAMGREARTRHHRLHLFTHEPVHRSFQEGMGRLGIEWSSLESLEENRVQAVRLLRGFDVVHLNLFAPRAKHCRLAYLAWPVPVVFVDRFSDPGAGTEDLPLPTRILDRITIRRIARYVGVSSYVVERAKARFGENGTSYRAILNAIDENVFSVSRPPSGDRGHLRVLTAAHLIREKGLHHALDAVAELVGSGIPIRLSVAGDGPEGESLREQAVQLGIQEEVDFLGLRDDVPALMLESDVFLHPATWGEAFGFTVAEAMAAGCVVVASRVGGIPEMVTDGVTGVLVEPGSSATIVDAVARLFRDPELRLRLSSSGREYALGHLGVSRCVSAHLDVLEEAAARRVRRATPR